MDELRAQLEELRELQALQDERRRRRCARGCRARRRRARALAEAVADRTDLPRRFTEDPVQTRRLLATTETLEAFAAGLAGVVDDEPDADVPDATGAKGKLPLPVQGEVLRALGEPDAARHGAARRADRARRPRALVTTPAAATIRFRGPLLDYGNVMILEPAPDLCWSSPGWPRSIGEPGQVVPAGAPVGLMGGQVPPPATRF